MANLSAFLYSEVPTRDEDASLVWVDRETELANAIALSLDQLQHPAHQPLAVVGSARVGKSHLLRKLLLAIKTEFQLVITLDLARGSWDERRLILEVLTQFTSQLNQFLLEKNRLDILEPFNQIRRDYGELISGSAPKITIQRSNTLANSFRGLLSASAGGKLSGSASLSLDPKISLLNSLLAGLGLPLDLLSLGKASASVGGEASLTGTTTLEASANQSYLTGQTVEVARFDNDQLIDLILLAHTLVQAVFPEHRSLLVLDDFDLVHREKDSRLNPVVLLQALKKLAATPGLFILTTVRKDTFHKKDFYKLVDVGPFPTTQPMLEIYNNHVKHFFPEQADPFQGAFVEQTALRCSGRVGLFLQALRDAWQQAGGSVTIELDAWMAGIWRQLKADVPKLADLLRKATIQESGILSQADADTLYQTICWEWVLDDYSSTHSVRVHPLLQAYLRAHPID
jgi:hypothetical protein